MPLPCARPPESKEVEKKWYLVSSLLGMITRICQERIYVLDDAGCLLEVQLDEGLLLRTEVGGLIKFEFDLELGLKGH